MNTSSKIAILLFGVCALIAGAWFAIGPSLKDRQAAAEKAEAEKFEQSITDAKVKSSLIIAGDSYLGYFFAAAKQTRKEAARQGLGIKWIDDGAAISERVQKLKSGEYDIITIPAAEYLLHGSRVDFPGVIVAGIANSNGGDGIVALESKIPSGEVSSLNDSSLQWVYTGESPSEFLVEITVKDLDLFELRSADEAAPNRKANWRQPTSSSAEVYKRAMNGQGDVFVLWEPELSRSLQQNPNLKYIWGSDKFSGYIVDYFVVNKNVLAKRKGDVVRYFKAYFRSLEYYRRNAPERTKDMARWANIDSKTVEMIVNSRKIDWLDLHDNFQSQFGISVENSPQTAQEGVIDTILSCTEVLADIGRIKTSAVSDPYRLVSSSVLQALRDTAPRELGKGNRDDIDFSPLSPEGWKNLKQLATLQVRPIRFRSKATFDAGGPQEVDKLARLLAVNYPNHRVIIRGHTGGRDSETKQKLSNLRAQTVANRLIEKHSFDKDRLLIEGMGSATPPAPRPGENIRSRAYRSRVPRVEAILVERGGL